MTRRKLYAVEVSPVQYRILAREGSCTRLVAADVSKRDDAELFASSPELQQIAQTLYNVLAKMPHMPSCPASRSSPNEPSCTCGCDDALAQAAALGLGNLTEEDSKSLGKIRRNDGYAATKKAERRCPMSGSNISQ